MYIPIVLGTARAERQSEKVAHFILRVAKEQGIDAELVDTRDFAFGETIPAWVPDERAEPWREKVKKADAIILVLPEYNHGYPGELKMLLDSAYKEYAGTRVLCAGVSSGSWGGTRAVQNLEPVLLVLGLKPEPAIYFPKAQDIFDESGEVKNEFVKKSTEKALEKIIN